MKGKFRGLAKLRKYIQRHPERIVKRYLRDIRLELGVQREAWHMRHFSDLCYENFQSSLGLWRTHNYLHEILQLMLIRGRVPEGIACIVQLCKALHQAGLDGGRWKTAVHFLPFRDPLRRPTWGGTAEELSYIEGYMTANDRVQFGLRGKNQATRGAWDKAQPPGAAEAGAAAEGEEAEPGQRGRGRPRGGRAQGGRRGHR